MTNTLNRDERIVVMVQLEKQVVWIDEPILDLREKWRAAKGGDDLIVARGTNGGEVVIEPDKISYMREVEHREREPQVQADRTGP